MNVALVVPWRGTSPERVSALNAVLAALADALPDAELLLSDSGHEPFSRAASRNVGVLRAETEGADVVVVCDADTIPERDLLIEAVEAAGRDGLLHYPFTDYRGLSAAGTQAFYAGAALVDCETEYECTGSQGGVLVLRPKTWFAAGGMDERFTGWGFEDTAFSMAVRTLVGDVTYHPGAIHHLWHPSAMDITSATYRANRALCERYMDAYGDADRTRKVRAGD